MRSDERVQDLWYAHVHLIDKEGNMYRTDRGILALPTPQRGHEAARLLVALRAADDGVTGSIHAVIWSVREEGREPGKFQLTGCVAIWDETRGIFVGESDQKELPSADGVELIPVDWKQR